MPFFQFGPLEVKLREESEIKFFPKSERRITCVNATEPTLLCTKFPKFVFCYSGSCYVEFGKQKYTMLENEGIALPRDVEVCITSIGSVDSKAIIIDLDQSLMHQLYSREKNDKNIRESRSEERTVKLDQVLIEGAYLLLAEYMAQKNQRYLIGLLDIEFHKLLFHSLGFDQVRDVLTSNHPHPSVIRSLQIIQEKYNEISGPDELASKAGIATSTLFLLFREHLGVTPLAAIRKIRLDTACEMLLNNEMVSQVGYAVGYSHHCQFTRDFKAAFGISPKRWVDMATSNPVT